MNAQTETKQEVAPIKAFQQQLTEQWTSSFTQLLPPQIKPEVFQRVVLTAVQKQPALLGANRASLFTAVIEAATDGLLPDGREGAMVIFKSKGGDTVKWMPMIAGLLKKVRNSGELKSVAVRLVYGGDLFRYYIDETGEHLQYEAADNPDKNIFRRAFALATTKDGGSYVEVMDADDIEKVRQASKSKDSGPWISWWEEMVKKTALRRLCKRLPMSTDVEEALHRDDGIYDLERSHDQRPVERPRDLEGRLDGLVFGVRGGAVQMNIPHDAETGEIMENRPSAETPTQAGVGRAGRSSSPTGTADPKAAQSQSPSSAAEPSAGRDAPPTSAGGSPSQAEARAAGARARTDGQSRKAVPAAFKAGVLRAAWEDGFDTGEAEDNEPGAEEVEETEADVG